MKRITLIALIALLCVGFMFAETNNMQKIFPTTSDEYKENGKEKFLNANPAWTEEMYQVIQDSSTTEYKQIFDYGYGISGTLSDDNVAEDGSCVTRKLYEYTNKTDDSGKQYTWSELRETYSPTVDSALKAINSAIADYIAKENG